MSWPTPRSLSGALLLTCLSTGPRLDRSTLAQLFKRSQSCWNPGLMKKGVQNWTSASQTFLMLTTLPRPTARSGTRYGWPATVPQGRGGLLHRARGDRGCWGQHLHCWRLHFCCCRSCYCFRRHLRCVRHRRRCCRLLCRRLLCRRLLCRRLRRCSND